MSKVLIVEDDSILLKMYRDKFKNSGFEVATASGGKEGIAKAINDQPDFIILDLMMPQIDGVQVLSHLKSNIKTKSIPVGILTVVPREQAGITEDLSKEITHYWPKDTITPSDLVEDVKQNLETNKGGQY